MKITEENAGIVLSYPGEKKILLFGWKKKEDEYPTERNIYMMHKGNVLWRVSSDRDDDEHGRFTNIWIEGDEIHAYRWDGAEYIINPENGFATAIRFLK